MTTRRHPLVELGTWLRGWFSAHPGSDASCEEPVPRAPRKRNYRPFDPCFDPLKSRPAMWTPNVDARPYPGYVPAPLNPPELDRRETDR
jgi:hypothetical protein